MLWPDPQLSRITNSNDRVSDRVAGCVGSAPSDCGWPLVGGRGKASTTLTTAQGVPLALWQQMALAAHSSAWGKETGAWDDDDLAVAAMSLNHATVVTGNGASLLTPAQLKASLAPSLWDGSAVSGDPLLIPATAIALALSATLAPEHQAALATLLAELSPDATQWGTQTYWQTVAHTVNLLNPETSPLTAEDALTYGLAHGLSPALAIMPTLPDSPFVTVDMPGDSPLWSGATVPAALFASIAAGVEAEGGETPTGIGVETLPTLATPNYHAGLFQPTPLPTWTQADFAHVAEQIDSDPYTVAANLGVPFPPLPDWAVAHALTLQHQTTLNPALKIYPTLAAYADLAQTLGSDATGQPITTGDIASALYGVPHTLQMQPQQFLDAVALAGFAVPPLEPEGDLDMWLAEQTLATGLTELDDTAWDTLGDILSTDGVTLQTAVLGSLSQTQGLTLANKHSLDQAKGTMGDWTLEDFVDLAGSLAATNHASNAVTPQMIASYVNIEPQIGGMSLSQFADVLDGVGWGFDNVDDSFLPHVENWVAEHTTPNGKMLPLSLADWSGLATGLTEGDIGGAELKALVLGTGTSFAPMDEGNDLWADFDLPPSIWYPGMGLPVAQVTAIKPLLENKPIAQQSLATFSAAAQTLNASNALGYIFTAQSLAETMGVTPKLAGMAKEDVIGAIFDAGLVPPNLNTESVAALHDHVWGWGGGDMVTVEPTSVDYAALAALVGYTSGEDFRTAFLGHGRVVVAIPADVPRALWNGLPDDLSRKPLEHWTIEDLDEAAGQLLDNYPIEQLTTGEMAAVLGIRPDTSGVSVKKMHALLTKAGIVPEYPRRDQFTAVDRYLKTRSDGYDGLETLRALADADWDYIAGIYEYAGGGAGARDTVLGRGVTGRTDVVAALTGAAEGGKQPNLRRGLCARMGRLISGLRKAKRTNGGSTFMTAWEENLSDEHRQGTRTYTTHFYSTINNGLLGFKEPTTEAKAIIPVIDRSLATAPVLAHDMIVYRYEKDRLDQPTQRVQQMRQDIVSGKTTVGSELEYPNFMSTTLSTTSWSAGHFNGGLSYEITIPAGTRLPYIAVVAAGPGEREAAMPRGSSLLVDEIRDVGDMIYIRATYFPPQREAGNDDLSDRA